MSEPSDIPPLIESLTIFIFYFIGVLSLVVNCITLFVIIWKGDRLDCEIRVLSAFLQVSCLVQNVFTTIIFIPFLYSRAGAGYCMGALSGVVPYQTLFNTFTILTVFMFSAFGMLIIARQQMLLFDSSKLKLSGPVRKLAYVLVIIFFQCISILVSISSYSDRAKQELALSQIYPHLRWRERNLNWYKFTISDSPTAHSVIRYGFWVAIPAGCALIFLPFFHMTAIVIRAGKRVRHRKQQRNVHMRNAQTIVIQFFVLLIFFIVPMAVGLATMYRDNIYADSQTAMAVAELLFACSSLANSYVVVARNRAYLSAITFIFRRNRSITPVSTTSKQK